MIESGVIYVTEAGGHPLGGPDVRVFDALTGLEKFHFTAYDPGFTGGVRVGATDRDVNGRDDVMTGAGPFPGGGTDVRILDGVTLTDLDRFFAYDFRFPIGVFVAGSRPRR